MYNNVFNGNIINGLCKLGSNCLKYIVDNTNPATKIQGIPGYIKIIQGVPEYDKIVQGVPEYEKIKQGVPEYDKIMHQSVSIEKLSSIFF